MIYRDLQQSTLEPSGGPRGDPTQYAKDEYNAGMLCCDYVSIFHLTQKEWKGLVCNKLRRVGVLGALGGKFGSEDHQLCFMDLVINEITMQTLVDSGASHNFLKTEVVKELGLIVMKVVNCKENATIDVASSVHIWLEKWEGWANFMVMPIDDFEVILGQDFLRRTRSVLMPWMENMVILGEQKAWVVCTTVRKSG